MKNGVETSITWTYKCYYNSELKFSKHHSRLQVEHIPALRESEPSAFSNMKTRRFCSTRIQAFTALALCCGYNHFLVAMHLTLILAFNFPPQENKSLAQI